MQTYRLSSKEGGHSQKYNGDRGRPIEDINFMNDSKSKMVQDVKKRLSNVVYSPKFVEKKNGQNIVENNFFHSKQNQQTNQNAHPYQSSNFFNSSQKSLDNSNGFKKSTTFDQCLKGQGNVTDTMNHSMVNKEKLQHSWKQKQNFDSNNVRNQGSQIRTYCLNNQKKQKTIIQKVEYLQPKFQDLFTIFGDISFQKQNLKEITNLFIKWQIQKHNGSTFSKQLEKNSFQKLSLQQKQTQLSLKYTELVITKKIIQLFRQEMVKIELNKIKDRNKCEVSSQIWGYFMQYYQLKLKQLLQFCHSCYQQTKKQTEYSMTAQNIIERIQFLNEESKKFIKKNRSQNKQPYLEFQQEDLMKQLQLSIFKKGRKKRTLKPDSYQIQLEQTFLQKIRFYDQLIRKKKWQKQSQYFNSSLNRGTTCRSYIRRQKNKKSNSFFQRINSFQMQFEDNIRINYNINIEWFINSDNEQPYYIKQYQQKHVILVPEYINQEDLEKKLINDIINRYKESIRFDANFYFSPLIRTTSCQDHQLTVTVKQFLINLPNSYQYQVNVKKGTEIDYLKIQNQYGVAIWNQCIDLEKVDFHLKTIQIGMMSVMCYNEVLNRLCIVKFKDLPREMQGKSQKDVHAIDSFRQFINKKGNLTLIGINFSQNTFLVQFQNFKIGEDEIEQSVSCNNSTQ